MRSCEDHSGRSESSMAGRRVPITPRGDSKDSWREYFCVAVLIRWGHNPLADDGSHSPILPFSSMVLGIHHVTAISGHIEQNLEFYTGVMGMRLVKKSINQDDVKAYHL